MWRNFKWFWKYYRAYPYVLAVLVILTPVQTVFRVWLPKLIEYAVDFVKTGAVSDDRASQWIANAGNGLGLSTAAAFSLLLVTVGLLATVLYSFVQCHRAWMNLKLEWLFRQDAFAKITERGPDFFNHFRTGDIVTRLTDDVAEKLSWFACSGIFRLYEALLLVVFTVVMMASIDPMLTFWSVAPLPLLIVIFFRSASLLEKRYDHLQTRISRFTDVMEACFTGIRVVKAYVKEGTQRKKFDSAIDDRRNAEISAVRTMAVIESLYMYIWQFGILIVLLIGGYMAIESGLSLGKLVAFIYYEVSLVFPMFDIGQFLVKYKQSAVSIERLSELERFAPMVVDSAASDSKSAVSGEIAFDNASFGFKGMDRLIINGVSLRIDAGETVAIVGRVGSGKSWLVNMIPRLVDPSSGSVSLDRVDLRSLGLKRLRGEIGYVPQEPVLFSDTIRNNILLGREGVSDLDIDWAIEVSQLKGEIEQFPDGLQTSVGTRGMTLSGGQKQRLSLARALVGKPKILILDDCTSALDSSTEAALWTRLHEVMPEMTAVVITHRPDTLEKADRVFVMHEGRLIESGTHAELVERSEHYSKIYRRYRLEQEVALG